MKKIKRTLVTVLALSLTLCSFTGCWDRKGSNDNEGSNSGKSGFFGIGETKYSAECNFFYSADKGHSYGDGTKEYEIGDTVYMKVKFKVTSNKKKASKVSVTLTIPKIDSVDAKYLDGQIITPEPDPINNVTTYTFTTNASKEAIDQECVIQFVPNAVGEVPMTLVFDDNVDPSYDKQSTLIFVEPKVEETTTNTTSTTTTTTTTSTTTITKTTTSTEESTSESSSEKNNDTGMTSIVVSTDTTTTAVEEETNIQDKTEEE